MRSPILILAAIGVGLFLFRCHLLVPTPVVTVGAVAAAVGAFTAPAGRTKRRDASHRRHWRMATLLLPVVGVALAAAFLHGHPQFLCGVAVVGLFVGPRSGGILRLAVASIGLWVVFHLRLGLPIPPVSTAAVERAWLVGVMLPVIVGTVCRVLCRWPTAALGAIGSFVAIAGLFAMTGSAVVSHPLELPLVLAPVVLCCALSPLMTGMSTDGRGATLGLAVAVLLFGVHHAGPVAAAIGVLVERCAPLVAKPDRNPRA